MWVNKFIYQCLNENISTQRTRADVAEMQARTLSEQNKVLQTNMDWMRLRLTQMEKERAQLMFQLMGVKVPVPEIEQVRIDLPGELQHPLNQMPSFEDVGDEEAHKLGYK